MPKSRLPYSVLVGDNLTVLQEQLGQADSSIDCIITSPPYKKKDGWDVEVFVKLCEQLYRVLKPGRCFFLNAGALADGPLMPYGAVLAACEAGFDLRHEIALVKRQYTPVAKSVKTRLDHRWEHLFLLVKGEPLPWDRFSIGVPYEDKSNAKRFNNGVDLKCPGTVWDFAYDTVQKSEQKAHPHEFPLSLPERCLKLANLPPNAVVLDPFSGGGTTVLAAVRLGFRGLGIERDAVLAAKSLKRIKAGLAT